MGWRLHLKRVGCIINCIVYVSGAMILGNLNYKNVRWVARERNCFLRIVYSKPLSIAFFASEYLNS